MFCNYRGLILRCTGKRSTRKSPEASHHPVASAYITTYKTNFNFNQSSGVGISRSPLLLTSREIENPVKCRTPWNATFEVMLRGYKAAWLHIHFSHTQKVHDDPAFQTGLRWNMINVSPKLKNPIKRKQQKCWNNKCKRVLVAEWGRISVHLMLCIRKYKTHKKGY